MLRNKELGDLFDEATSVNDMKASYRAVDQSCRHAVHRLPAASDFYDSNAFSFAFSGGAAGSVSAAESLSLCRAKKAVHVSAAGLSGGRCF